MPSKSDELIPTRRSLLSRLKQWDDDASWQDFFDTYWKLIYGVAIRSGLNETEAQDVVQDTIVAVARQMPNFKYDPGMGSFKNWLLLITRRRITDHLRKKYRRVKLSEPGAGETSRTAQLERIPDPAGPELDAVWEEEWQQQLANAALQRVKRQVDSTQFQIFDCYVVKGWAVKDVTATFSVNANQVYIIKHRISALLAAEVKKLEANPASH